MQDARPIRLLMVADGYHYLGQPYGLDYSAGPMGLSRFLESLLGRGFPARFEIALAHLDLRSGPAMMDFDARIGVRMPRFAFDDPAQFQPDAFDAVFLFGCVEQLSRDDPQGRRRLAADGGPYPLDRLADSEIAMIAAFQQDGGGLFVAGDAGRAGSVLSQGLPRAGQMRRWTGRTRPGPAEGAGSRGRPPLAPPPGTDGAAPGPAGRQADPAAPRPGDGLDPAAAFGPEFPAAIDGGPRPLPERVRAGPPGATGLCAYDGHRAGIGRTLTAATWRPFLNGALSDLCVGPSRPGEAFAGGRATIRHRLDAHCAALAIWLARPEAVARRPSRA